MKLRRLAAVARKEGLHIIRDTRSVVLALLMPLVMLLMFGYALSLDVDRIPTVVLDRDGTPQSRELLRQFSGSRYFTIAGSAGSPADVDAAIDRGTALVGIAVSPGFGADLGAGREAAVQIVIDGSDSNTASIALAYTDALIQAYDLRLRSQAQIRRGAGELKSAVDLRARFWYNANLKSRNYIVPGLIAVILMIIASLLTSLTIAREWETGTMEQLLSTPVRPSELVLGKISAYFVLGMVDVLICLVVGVGIFGVPLRGNTVLLLLSCCIFLFGALCWGVMISASTRSQVMAYQMGIISSFLPSFLLSGFIYAIENMPVVIQAITHIVPARYFIALLRGIFLKGTGVEVLAGELAFLSAYAVVVFLIASRMARQKVA